MATTTRTQLVRLHRKSPRMPASELASRLGVTRQRVHALARREGLTLTPPPRSTPPLGNCEICHRKLQYPGTTTHAKCHYVKLKCSGCGVAFHRPRSERRAKKQYHSRECFQAHRGKR